MRELPERGEDEFVTLAGMITAVRRTITKAQQQMLFATIEDLTGSIELIVFPKSYPELQAAFVVDEVVVVKGRVRSRERRGAPVGDDAPVERTVAVNEVAKFQGGPPPPDAWHVTVERREQIDALADLLDASPGPVPVVLHAGGATRRMSAGIAQGWAVRSALEAIFSQSGVRQSTGA